MSICLSDWRKEQKVDWMAIKRVLFAIFRQLSSPCVIGDWHCLVEDIWAVGLFCHITDIQQCFLNWDILLVNICGITCTENSCIAFNQPLPEKPLEVLWCCGVPGHEEFAIKPSLLLSFFFFMNFRVWLKMAIDCLTLEMNGWKVEYGLR